MHNRNLGSMLTRLGLIIGLVLAVGAPARAQEPDGSPPDDVPGGAMTADDVAREGWGVQPAGPDGTPLRSSFAYNLAPGQVIRDRVLITNLADEPLHVDLYARDAFNTSEDGAFALQAVEEDPEGAGSWVTIGFDDVVVPPQKASIVTFELEVPEDAVPGDHAAGIIAANRDLIESSDATGMAVDVRQRIASRIYVRVDGPTTAELRVEDLAISSSTPLLPFAQGRTEVSYTVENVGNVRMTAAADLKVKGLFGRRVHAFPAEDLPELLPGGRVVMTRAFDGVPPVERLTASLDLVSIDGEATESAGASTFAWAWATPILLLAVAAAVAIRRFRRTADGDAEEAGGDAEAMDPPDRDGAADGGDRGVEEDVPVGGGA